MPPATKPDPEQVDSASGANLMDAFNAAMPGVSPGVFDEADFNAIAEIAHSEAGIVLTAAKAMLVFSRLSPMVRNTNCATFASYVMRIREDAEERRRAIGALTICQSDFYRHPQQFEHFVQAVRPGLVERLLNGGKVRLWSAGCASGEEAWSLLMILLGEDAALGQAIARTDLRMLATDIATPAIAKARLATYRTDDLNALPAPLSTAWTVDQGEQSTIAPEVQHLVRYRALNLLEEWPMQWQFDTIFCRNVLHNFDEATKERLLLRLTSQLAPGGWLYLSADEELCGVAGEMLTPAGLGVYRTLAA